MALVRIEGVVASTRPLDAYGGVQFGEDWVKSLADHIKDGKVGWELHHDPRARLDVRVIDAFTRADADGHIEAVVSLEVDEDEWERKGGNTASGFSVSGRKRLLGESGESPAVTVAADAHWFSDDEIRAAFEELSKVGGPVQGCRLYQFAAEPPALVTLAFLLQQLSSIPAGLLCSYIYDALRHFVGTRKEPSKFSLTFDNETGSLTHAYLETASDDVLKHAIDALPGILDRAGEYEYADSERTWKATG